MGIAAVGLTQQQALLALMLSPLCRAGSRAPVTDALKEVDD